MSTLPVLSPRQIAGRANRLKRKKLPASTRERLRAAALRHRPWQYSTGPRTVAGKAISAANGRRRQTGPLSVRQRRALTADHAKFANVMAELRRTVAPKND
jgi:hypothetical protein